MSTPATLRVVQHHLVVYKRTWRGGLVFSFPCRSDGRGNYQIVEGLDLSAYARQKLEVTANELIGERNDVSELL